MRIVVLLIGQEMPNDIFLAETKVVAAGIEPVTKGFVTFYLHCPHPIYHTIYFSFIFAIPIISNYNHQHIR